MIELLKEVLAGENDLSTGEAFDKVLEGMPQREACWLLLVGMLVADSRMAAIAGEIRQSLHSFAEAGLATDVLLHERCEAAINAETLRGLADIEKVLAAESEG